MKYPIAIEWGNEKTAIGIHIPDLDIATAGDTYEEAYVAALEVAGIALQDFADNRQEIPLAKTVEAHKANPEYVGMGWGLLDVDISPYLGTTAKVNVTLPERLIYSIDQLVATDKSKSRSSFLAEAAVEKLAKS